MRIIFCSLQFVDEKLSEEISRLREVEHIDCSHCTMCKKIGSGKKGSHDTAGKEIQGQSDTGMTKKRKIDHVIEGTSASYVDVEHDLPGDQHTFGDKSDGAPPIIQQVRRIKFTFRLKCVFHCCLTLAKLCFSLSTVKERSIIQVCLKSKTSLIPLAAAHDFDILLLMVDGDATQTSSSSCMFQYLVEFVVGMKVTPLTQSNELCIMVHHQSSGNLHDLFIFWNFNSVQCWLNDHIICLLCNDF